MNQDVTQDVEHVTVMLEKAPNEQGFGIAISGGREGADQRGGDTSITISDVIRGSPADTLVNIGDVLIAINGTNVEDVEHGFALIKRRLFSYNNVKRESIPKLNMSVSSTPNFRINDRISCEREHLSRQKENEFLGFQQENHKKCKTGDRDDGICDNYQEISFSLDKGKSGFGLYLGNMIFVKDKVTGTSAENSGIQVGDINGVPVECCRSTDEVLDLIKKSGKILNLGVLRPNTCWLPRPLALKTSYFTSTTPSNIKKKSHRRISSDLKTVSVKPAVDDVKKSKKDKNATKEKRLMDELNDNITSRSIVTSEVGVPYQPSRSISPVTRIKKGQSLNRFDYQKIPSIKENPRFRERKSSRMTETKDTRTVKIINSGEHLGVQLIGGNKSGIFISALMDNSPAALSGLRIGDQIVMVNDVDFRHVTREEAVIVLLSLKNGPPNNPRELTLRKGELLIVRDTMFGGTIGSWSAAKVSINAEPGESGVIPNKARAEQSAVKSKLQERKNKEIKRRLRSGKNHAINSRDDDSLEIPAYERVARRIEFRNAAVNMVYGQNEDKIDKKEIKNINRYGVRFERKYPMHIDGNNIIFLKAIIHVLDQPVDKIYMELMNVDHNVIDSYILHEPNYASGCTSNSESCTEDDDMESNGEKKENNNNIELSLSAVLKIPSDNQGGLTESPSTKVSVYVPSGMKKQKIQLFFVDQRELHSLDL
ncbi:hypothetical protein MXB_4171 [Myxobolus squamalis]|nr:hypothetical protein MXB_4171 [Myxobolus squamalis]